MRVISVFVEPPMFALFSLLCSVLFLLGLFVLFCPSCGLADVSVGCYINIAGRKPVSRECIFYLLSDLVSTNCTGNH